MSKDILRIAGTVNDSIVDGPGMRFAIFTQGCHRNCPGCHNQHTQDPNGGQDISVEELVKQISKNPLLSGVTLTGGEPTEQAEPLINLLEQIKNLHLETAIYSGATWEELMHNPLSKVYQLISMCDVLVDGEFEEDKKSLELKFKGSSNQRSIDVKKSIESGNVILMNDGRWN